jgi:hypothetical protein
MFFQAHTKTPSIKQAHGQLGGFFAAKLGKTGKERVKG